MQTLLQDLRFSLRVGGLALGLGLGALLGRVLSVVLYQVSPFDPASFITAPATRRSPNRAARIS